MVLEFPKEYKNNDKNQFLEMMERGLNGFSNADIEMLHLHSKENLKLMDQSERLGARIDIKWLFNDFLPHPVKKE
jgi:hypothetical protein